MWPFDGATRNALAQSHTALSKLVVLHSGRPVYTLSPLDGDVTAQAGRTVLRNLGATAADPTGQLGGGDITDLLSPYDTEIAAFRGVRRGGLDVYAPLGVFGITKKQAKGDGTVVLTGQDRAMKYQGPMTGALAINGGTPLEDAIATLLRTRNSGLRMRTWKTGVTVGPALYQPDIDVWGEAQKLAQSNGGWLYHDREGDLIFCPLTATSLAPDVEYIEGRGVLLTADRTEDADSIHNVVVVQSGNATGTTGVITATAEDTNPNSPTYSRGRYGRRVLVITNEHVTSVAQAQQAANIALIRELGRSETVTATVVPHPGLDVLDAAIVHRPIAGLINRTLITDQITVPLVADQPMSITFRKYILTRDGRTIQTDLEPLT